MGSGLFGIHALYIRILCFYSSNLAIGCNIFYLLDFLFQSKLKGWFQVKTFDWMYLTICVIFKKKTLEKAKENRDEEMRLEQIPKFFREKNENLKDSIILRKTRASDESRKESDVSSSLNIKF